MSQFRTSDIKFSDKQIPKSTRDAIVQVLNYSD